MNIKPKAHASLTKSEVCEVLDEDVGCVFGPDRSRLEEPEARLHENDDWPHDHEEKGVDIFHKDNQLFCPVATW